MPDLSRRQYVLVVLGIFAAATLIVGVYGLIAGPHEHTANDPAHAMSSPTTAPTPVAATAPVLAPPTQEQLTHTTDPVAYARSVAAALFDWDTSSGFAPSDYSSPVLADADPSGEETAGLITDVATFVPTADQWLALATMDVRQTLAIDSAAVPSSWPAVAATAHGELRHGTIAVTISGSRTRTGTWRGEAQTTSAPVSFTVFVACPPAFDRCHILRLSQLDNPLR